MNLQFTKKLLLLTLNRQEFKNDNGDKIPFYRADLMDSDAGEVFKCTVDKSIVDSVKVGNGYNFKFNLFIGTNQTRLKIIDIE